ncbi:hypothetical protein D3C84_1143500 [compost metagenome]
MIRLVRSLEARCQKSNSGWPISGQLATDSLGAGTCSSPLLISSMATCTDSAMDDASR